MSSGQTTNQFFGMSSLREREKVQEPPSEKAKALQAYLAKYASEGQEQPKKKKRKKVAAPARNGVKIIDRDASGFKVHTGESEDEEDAPVIANPGEAEKYMRERERIQSGAAFENWQMDERPQVAKKPPARKARHDSPDASPPRKRPQQRHDSPDESPPRRQKLRHDSPDESPPRKPRQQRHDSPDESPPRRSKQQRHDSPDASPPRKRRHDTPDLSPPRKGHQPESAHKKQADESPPRRRREADESPPRRKRRHGSSDESPPRRQTEDKKSAKNMTDGTAAGMVSGKALAEEMAKKREADRKRFAQLEAESGGRNAETVYRDKATGRKISQAEYEEARKKAAEREKPKYETPAWGGGMRQIRDKEELAEATKKEAARPFARSLAHVDEDLNLRDRSRFGDPMAHLVRQKAEAAPAPVISQKMAKSMGKSGFTVPQEVPAHSWLKRRMGPPPNRYGIRPGRHWDGVDRSNGFERDMFRERAKLAAQEQERRAWAQADM